MQPLVASHASQQLRNAICGAAGHAVERSEFFPKVLIFILEGGDVVLLPLHPGSQLHILLGHVEVRPRHVLSLMRPRALHPVLPRCLAWRWAQEHILGRVPHEPRLGA